MENVEAGASLKSRVAGFMVQQLENGRYLRQAVTVTTT
jgi:hypothetical protein